MNVQNASQHQAAIREVNQTKEIPEQVACLSARIATIADTVIRLKERLEPVLNHKINATTAESPSAPTPVFQSSLGNDIATLKERLDEVCANLDRIHSCLEV